MSDGNKETLLSFLEEYQALCKKHGLFIYFNTPNYHYGYGIHLLGNKEKDFREMQELLLDVAENCIWLGLGSAQSTPAPATKEFDVGKPVGKTEPIRDR